MTWAISLSYITNFLVCAQAVAAGPSKWPKLAGWLRAEALPAVAALAEQRVGQVSMKTRYGFAVGVH
jgi:hypothetical protein